MVHILIYLNSIKWKNWKMEKLVVHNFVTWNLKQFLSINGKHCVVLGHNPEGHNLEGRKLEGT